MAELVVRSKVSDFVKSLEKKSKTRTLKLLLLLEKHGHELREPHTKKLSGKLFELRARGQQEVRLIFCYKDNKIFVLTGFVKKTQQTPRSEIERAERDLKLLDI